MKKPGAAIPKKTPLKKKSSATGPVTRGKSKSSGQFPIVAIGASAGGLEAITEFLKNLPSDTGMAFIYVQHLSPDHKSMLAPILSKSTKMKVHEIDDMDKIMPNNVFVIPHNKSIKVIDGHIKLIPRSRNGSAITIDVFFTSLAQVQKERVIGIILSGSASDGARGIQEIKQEGGLTFAQDNTAKFTSMPQSAIATGVVDFILSPKQMALELANLSKHPFVKASLTKPPKEDLIENGDPDLQNILNHLRRAVGVDFSVYKMNTIKRRIIRRMLLHKITDLKEYGKFLIEKKAETDNLYQDLLINVTSFFRDGNACKYLQTVLFPKMLKSKKNGAPLRIWVPACSTGEEVYSIAMILLELQGEKAHKVPIQIFATDISEQSIAKARTGLFSKPNMETVSPKRIQRFFTKTDMGYRISKSVREICVFAPHNVLNDPPFSRLDFISCCNLFIYFDTAAQKKTIATFHYALNDTGYLMLGKSETVGAAAQLFTAENKKLKLFSRKKNSGIGVLPRITPPFSRHFILNENSNATARIVNSSKLKYAASNQSLDSAINDVLVSEFVPASVVIGHNMEIIQFRGSTDLYLTNSPGKPTFNVLKMARPEIALVLRSAIASAIKTGFRVRKRGIEMKVDSNVRTIGIEVFPLKIEWDEPLLLILFTEQEQVQTAGNTAKRGNKNIDIKDRRIKKLEEELAAVQADALAFAQEQEAYTEELQSAAEEVVSSNEELQTMNEELETSKEEIESVNEELRTTNDEMQTRNDLLNEAYEYSEAVTATIHDPMLILDKELRVKSANVSFYKTFFVKERETEGMLIYDLGNGQWDIPQLREFLAEIILKNTLVRDFEISHTFQHIGHKVMLLNASRIIQRAHREQLILLIIKDVTEIRAKTEELRQNNEEILKQEIVQQKQQSQLLEETVNQRTKDLTLANRELERKNDELNAFNYVSSHDLQEPLRKIQTLSGRILEKEKESLSTTGKDYFRRMQEAAQRMQTLINDLLTFSRLNTTERKFQRTDLGVIINDIKKELAETLAEKGATIEVTGICEADIIPFQFRQLILNLISNSLKFTNPKIPPRITISCDNIEYSKIQLITPLPHKEYCHIAITDNGIGFEEEFSEKIFELFQQLHGKEEYGGTGIGLAIVKKIVENHNGIITATSELNKGAAFDIYIPLDN